MTSLYLCFFVFSIFLTKSSNTSNFSRIPSSLYVKRKTCSMLQGGKLHTLECTVVHLMHARHAVKMRSRSTCYIIYGCLTPLCKQITETAFDGFANAYAPLFFTHTHTHAKQTHASVCVNFLVSSYRSLRFCDIYSSSAGK